MIQFRRLWEAIRGGAGDHGDPHQPEAIQRTGQSSALQRKSDLDTWEREAKGVLAKARSPLLSRAIRAIPFGLEMALVAIVIPTLVRDLSGKSLVWPGVAVVAGAVLLRIVRQDSKLRAKVWWAETTLRLKGMLDDLGERFYALDRDFERGERRISALGSALETLASQVLKSELVACQEGEVSADGHGWHLKTRISAEVIRADLKAICRYVAELFSIAPGNHRCGVLVEHPNKPSQLAPLVVFHPDDENYTSQALYSLKEDFSGNVLARFHRAKGKTDWKHHLRFVIADVKSGELSKPSYVDRLISLRSHQDYIRSISGSVIYCVDAKGEQDVLGILNIDSDEPGGITEEIYDSLEPYLLPAFRLIAERLLILRRTTDLFDKVWLGPSATKGGTK